MAAQEQPVVMNLSNEVLQAFVQAAVMKALPEDTRLRMVESVVNHALTVKADGYSRETVFEKALREAMTQEAQAQCKAYLDEMRPEIAKRIREQIKRRNYADKIVDSLMEGLSIVRFHISVGKE